MASTIEEKKQIINEMLQEMKQVPQFKHLKISGVFTSETTEMRERMGSSGGFMPYPVALEYQVKSNHIYTFENVLLNIDLNKTAIKDNTLIVIYDGSKESLYNIDILTKFLALTDDDVNKS